MRMMVSFIISSNSFITPSFLSLLCVLLRGTPCKGKYSCLGRSVGRASRRHLQRLIVAWCGVLARLVGLSLFLCTSGTNIGRVSTPAPGLVATTACCRLCRISLLSGLFGGCGVFLAVDWWLAWVKVIKPSVSRFSGLAGLCPGCPWVCQRRWALLPSLLPLVYVSKFSSLYTPFVWFSDCKDTIIKAILE